MNYDLALISAILETGDFASAVHSGIKPKFLGDEASAYWDIISDHYDQFGQTPSLDYFQGLFTTYQHRLIPDPIDAIAHEIKTRHLHLKIEDTLEKVADLNDADPWEARQTLARLSDTITIEVQKVNTDLVAGSDKAEVLKRLEFLRNNDGLLGYKWPWEHVNQASPGVCNGNFIYIYGREGVRKTFLLCYLADWFEKQGLRVLFFTREMTLEEIAWRLYPMRVGLPYTEMTTGTLTSNGLLKLEDAMDDLYQRKNLIVTEVDGGLAGFRAKIEEVKPQVVIHDYMFAMAEDEMEGTRMREHDAIGKVVNGIKRSAMKLKIPIISCGHANRDGVKLKGRNSTELAGSDKIARRADYGIRVIVNNAEDHLALIWVKARQARTDSLTFTMDATLCNGFGNFVSHDTKWVEGVDETDEGEKDGQSKLKLEKDEPQSKVTAEGFQGRAKSFRVGT
jgi:replicative DNA helicase